MNSHIALYDADALAPIVIDASAALTRPMTAKGRDYWLACRGDRVMPARKDISPQGMREFINNVGLVDVHRTAGGVVGYSIRLAGAKIESVFGSITGRAIGDFLPPQIEARWRHVFDAALASSAPLSVASRVAFGRKEYLAAELFMAPLGEDGQVSMLFAAVDVWPMPGSMPA